MKVSGGRSHSSPHDEAVEQVGLMEFDDAGYPADEFVPASALASEREQYA
jgi:hypothetical protein